MKDTVRNIDELMMLRYDDANDEESAKWLRTRITAIEQKRKFKTLKEAKKAVALVMERYTAALEAQVRAGKGQTLAREKRTQAEEAKKMMEERIAEFEEAKKLLE